MTITVRADAARAALDAILALINAGSGDASGDFELLNSSNVSLTPTPMTFATPNAFAASSTPSGLIASAGSNAIGQSGTPLAGTNTIANGRFRDKANSAVMSFSISAAAGGGDMTVTDPVIPSNATAVSCSGITVTLNVTS